MSSRNYDDVIRTHSRVILQHQKSLEKATLQLRGLPGSCRYAKNVAGKAEIEDIANRVSSGVEAIGVWLRIYMDSSLVAEKFGDERRSAHTIFGIPKLLENIFSHLSLCDLRKIMRVNRCFKWTVDESTLLQQAMFLRPDNNSFFRSIGEEETCCKPCQLPTLQFRHSVKPLPLFTIGPPSKRIPREMEMEISFRGSDDFAARLTTKTRSMLVCQPPVSVIEVSTYCCNDPFNKRHPQNYDRAYLRMANTMTLFAPLTIGSLVDLTCKLREQHRSCPYAPQKHPGLGYYPDCAVTVYASVTVRDDEPLTLDPSPEERELRGIHLLPDLVAMQNHNFDRQALFRDHYTARTRSARDNRESTTTSNFEQWDQETPQEGAATPAAGSQTYDASDGDVWWVETEEGT
ncbi:hypothetical protein Q7P37_009513 [Cladosporium fusiforme]